LKEEILKFFRGIADDRPETLEKYSKDASIFQVLPQIVLYPIDALDVSNLVEWVSANKEKYPNLSITCRCAGTDMSGGAIGESIILDFTKFMNKLIMFSGDEITVEPGMLYRDFEKITSEKGMMLPCYTASKNLNALGGMYGNNSAGEKTLRYGQTAKYVLRAKVVFADGVERIVEGIPLHAIESEGELYKRTYELIKNNEEEIINAKPQVHKNSAGYALWNVLHGGVFDLNQLLVGSQGTLGIVTEITFKLVPTPRYSRLAVLFLHDLEPLGRLIGEILSENPTSVEAYDDKTLWLAVRFFRDFIKKRGFWSSIKFLFQFMPEFKMTLHGGLPKLVMLVEFSETTEEKVESRCRAMLQKIENFNIEGYLIPSAAASEKYWHIRRESFNLLRKHIAGKRTAPFIDDIIVRPEFLPKFLPELNKILKEYKLIYTLAGHAGDGNFHIIPLMDFSRDDTPRIISGLSEKVYDLVLRYRGSITAEHNDGLIRTPYLSKMYGEKITKIFKEVKNIFDPLNILNPGKKVPVENGPGTREYIGKHLALEHSASHSV